MRKKLLALSLVLALGVSLFSAQAAYAAVFQADEAVLIQNPVTDDLYISGGHASIDQAVDGDVIVAGGQVEINGPIAGDLIALGGTVNVNSAVADDVRIAGGEVYLNSTVGDDLLVAGGSVSMSPAVTVGGDVYAATGAGNLRGVVEGSVKWVGGSLIFSGNVKGNMRVSASDDLLISETARIDGNLTYSFLSEEFAVPEGVVGGTVEQAEFKFFNVEVPEVELGEVTEKAKGFVSGAFVALKLWQYLGMLVIGLILMLWAPRWFRATTVKVEKEFWKSFFYGLVFAIGVPVFAFLLLFSIIGVKLSVIIMLAWALVWPFAMLAGGYFVGQLILKPKKNVLFWRDFGGLALGLAILTIVKMIPVLGFFAYAIIILVAVGSLLLYKLDVLTELKKKKLV